MYEAFYQLNAEPFRLSPDPGFCFQHPSYRKAMTYMLHALHRAEGFIMVTGRPGTGKTTLIADLIQTLSPDQVVVAKIVSTQLTADDLLTLVAYSFDLKPEGCSKARILVEVERFLKHQHQIGRRALLIVDEAQDMGDEALEELRLLTNIATGTHQLLQVFLVGQEQLRNTVNTPSLEQLHQRLIAATALEPLSADDTRAYIKHRLRHVGWKGDPLISNETYPLIRKYSQGIPRLVNQICNRLLLHGSIEEKHRLGTADLRIVVEELQQERLLPAEAEDSAAALAWPAEGVEETWEEEAREEPPEQPPAAVAPPPPAPAREAPPEPPPVLLTETLPHPAPVKARTAPPRRQAANRPPPRPIPPPVPGRDPRTLRLLVLAGVFAGLLLLLMYATRTQYAPSTGRIAARPAAGESAPATARATPPRMTTAADDDAMRSGTVVRETLPARAVEGPAAPVLKKAPVEPSPAAPLEPLRQQTRDARSDTPDTSQGLEDELRRSGLQTERLDDGRIKINLSSDGVFDFDSADIRDSARPALDKLAAVLKRHRNPGVQILGHTDSAGVPEYNLHLSRLRARAVGDYLVGQGLADDRIQAEGRGDLDTRLEPATDANPRLKRRVEIYIRPDYSVP